MWKVANAREKKTGLTPPLPIHTPLATHPRACQVQSRMSGSPVAVRQAPHYLADDCCLVSDSSRRSLRSADVPTCVHGAANTQQLRQQNFCSRWSSLVELSSGPAAQSRHHLYGLFRRQLINTFLGKHEHGAL